MKTYLIFDSFDCTKTAVIYPSLAILIMPNTVFNFTLSCKNLTLIKIRTKYFRTLPIPLFCKPKKTF